MTNPKSELTPEELVASCAEAIDAIRPIMAGHTSEQCGYILAELIAMWLGGNVATEDDGVTVDPVGTAMFRGELLKLTIQTSNLLLHRQYDLSKSIPGETEQ